MTSTLHRHTLRTLSLSLLAAAALVACGSMPASNSLLDQAHSDYRTVQADGQALTLAPAEMKQAADALDRADAALAQGGDAAQVDQLAYLAKQRVALAQAATSRKGAESAVARASAERDRMRLTARTAEADAANQSAANAQLDARSAQRQTEAAQRQSATSQQQAANAQQQAASSQMQAGEAERRSAALQAQLSALNAKKTDRGMVVTIGDVLFDTDRAQLKSGGLMNIERLGSFLKQYPQRKASIEGYTDSTGSESHNQALSGRRADAVMSALLKVGVERGQLAAQGYGENYPVAGNGNASGRQMNRRVEIVLSDDNGVLLPR